MFMFWLWRGPSEGPRDPRFANPWYSQNNVFSKGTRFRHSAVCKVYVERFKQEHRIGWNHLKISLYTFTKSYFTNELRGTTTSCPHILWSKLIGHILTCMHQPHSLKKIFSDNQLSNARCTPVSEILNCEKKCLKIKEIWYFPYPHKSCCCAYASTWI